MDVGNVPVERNGASRATVFSLFPTVALRSVNLATLSAADADIGASLEQRVSGEPDLERSLQQMKGVQEGETLSTIQTVAAMSKEQRKSRVDRLDR